MSTFVSHLVADLAPKAIPLAPSPSSPPTPILTAAAAPSARAKAQTKEALRAVFVTLDADPAPAPAALRACIDTLLTLRHEREQLLFSLGEGGDADADEHANTHEHEDEDTETQSLRHAVLGRLALGLYAQALTAFLDEASEAEAERQWWADVVRSRSRTAAYLLQTLPLRLIAAAQLVLSTLRSQHIPLRFSALTPAALARLFPRTSALRPHTLTLALFPHLLHAPYAPSVSLLTLPKSPSALTHSFAAIAHTLHTLLTLPLQLAHDECLSKRDALTRIRDARATILGALAAQRDHLATALAQPDDPGVLTHFAANLHVLLHGDAFAPPLGSSADGVLDSLALLAHVVLPASVALHRAELSSSSSPGTAAAWAWNAGGLRRPGWWVRRWPRMLLLPPLVLWCARAAYAERATLGSVLRDMGDAVRGFVRDWVVEPLKDILRTVSAGRGDGVILARESVRADLDSLERMALALAREKLHYSAGELEGLARQVQAGDLTAVMEMYEEDIKRPLRSVVGGTLLRTLLVQLQKAKVDIDLALAGIDKLLKSQELTFAFVGVAPALGIVYGAGSYAARVWTGGRGRGRYGGKAKRTRVWAAMRRIDRLLTAQRGRDSEEGEGVPALTAGLLLLSVTELRRYGEETLAANSRLREGFLEDVGDLENPGLGRREKLRVVDRMWRSWSTPLGWSTVAD